MKLRGRPKAKPASTADAVADLRRELAAADAERADAVRARQDLEDRRGDVLMDEDETALEQHDHALAAVRRRIDIAESRHARLTLDVQAAEAASEQSRRQAIYDEAQAAIAKARGIIAGEYLPAARVVADIVNRAVALQGVALSANAELPEGMAPIDLMLEPEFNGRHYGGLVGLTEERVFYVNRQTGQRAGPHDAPELHANRGRWDRHTEIVERPVPAIAAESHKPVADFLNLPGLVADGYVFAAPRWGQPRS